MVNQRCPLISAFFSSTEQKRVLSPSKPSYSVPDKRGVLGQKPDKADNMTRQNKWSTWEDLKRSTSFDPSKFLIDPLPS